MNMQINFVTVGCNWNLDNVSSQDSIFDNSAISTVTKVC